MRDALLVSFSKGMTLRNVPSFDGPHAQTSPLHQVGDSFLSVFPSVGLAILDACFSSMNRGGGGRTDTTPQKSWLIWFVWTLSAAEPGLRAPGWMRTQSRSKQGSRPLNKSFPRTAGLLRRGRCVWLPPCEWHARCGRRGSSRWVVVEKRHTDMHGGAVDWRKW